MQEKIRQYLEERRYIHKKSGFLTVLEDIHFSALCQGNGDMLIAGSNSSRGIYSITTTFDGVGVLGTVTLLTSYMDHWKDVSALALSGEKLAISTDGVIYLHALSQGTKDTINGSNGFPVSSNAANTSLLGDDVFFCEGHCVKRINSGVVSVISVSVSPGDSDGSAPKLCRPLGICVECDRNMYLTDVGSGFIKLVNRPKKGMSEFLQNLQMLVRAFDIHSRKSPLTHSQSLVIPSTKESKWL